MDRLITEYFRCLIRKDYHSSKCLVNILTHEFLDNPNNNINEFYDQIQKQMIQLQIKESGARFYRYNEHMVKELVSHVEDERARRFIKHFETRIQPYYEENFMYKISWEGSTSASEDELFPPLNEKKNKNIKPKNAVLNVKNDDGSYKKYYSLQTLSPKPSYNCMDDSRKNRKCKSFCIEKK